VVVQRVLIRRLSARTWSVRALRATLRDSVVILITILTGMWFVPFIVGLLHIGLSAIAIPALLLAVAVYLVFRSFFNIQDQLEGTFRRTLLGEQYMASSCSPTLFGIRRENLEKLARKLKSLATGIVHRWRVDKAKTEKLKGSPDSLEASNKPVDNPDSDSTYGDRSD